ncbi:hypothetical protein DICVIV_12435 [Dictyocaulus viviparus]|uniref:Mitochondrial 2-oxodicarboxylate carrier n=1 Tax=Dictyocaulus viviparus TaxID=29172 RepID=A0A0D8XGV0_DICVI|nr:hypothetical protein DICVIV_12435 [Dictyocaulus viviparus]
MIVFALMLMRHNGHKKQNLRTKTEHIFRIMASDAIKDGTRQFVAGGSAGLVEVCLMHPLDLIKTRLQGILPPILAETPKRATKFFTFEQYRKLFASPDISPAISLSMAGLFCGFTEAIVINPFEVVKVRQQTERGVSLLKQESAAAVARKIINSDGMGTNGLYRGVNMIQSFLLYECSNFQIP